MATTTNFGWETPDDTDLVKDGAAAIRTALGGVDTSFVDLKGGTTGQILSKASNTDLDYTWITNDVGDITAVTAGTGITGGGTSGAVTVSFDQANYGGGQYAAGKNKFINGDFGIWQRGTTFTDPTTGTYTADRWRVTNATANPTSRSVTQQTFTAGTAPVAGYEGSYFIRQTLTTVGTCTGARLEQRIEDVRTFAGQTATISFWAKSDSNRTNEIILSQNFGSGGSTQVDTLTSTFATTSSWARFTFTVSIASVSGKTIGTSSFLSLRLGNALTNGSVLDFWGVQVEAGSTATPFQTASGGSPQAELAMCQRYYEKSYDQATAPATASVTNGLCVFSITLIVTGAKYGSVKFAVPKRVAPTVTIYGYQGGAGKVSTDATGADQAASSGTASLIGQGSFAVNNGSGSTVTTSNGTVCHFVAEAEL